MGNKLCPEIMDKFTRSVNKIIYASGVSRMFTVVFDGSAGSRVLYHAVFKTGRFMGCRQKFVHFKSWYESPGLSDLLKSNYPDVEIAEPPMTLEDAKKLNGEPSAENRWCCYAKGGYGWYKSNPNHGIVVNGFVLRNAQERETKSEYSTLFPDLTVLYPFMREWNESELDAYLDFAGDPLAGFPVRSACSPCFTRAGSCPLTFSGFSAADRDMSRNFVWFRGR